MEPDMTTQTYATEVDEKIRIINGTCCSEGYCREHGCDFPNCATFTNEEYATAEEAKMEHPDLEMV